MDQYAAKAVEFTSSIGDKPYFMMVNYPDAHLPFQNDVEGLPTVKVDRNRINSTLSFVGVNSERLFDETERYYNCMNRLDESIGMLLDSLGDLSNTVVIYLSDHGAQFSRGKLTNYEGGLKVPFIVHWPDRYPVQNEVRDELISVVDILPTVMEIAGIEKPDFLPGKSLIGLLDNPNQEEAIWQLRGRDHRPFSIFHAEASEIILLNSSTTLMWGGQNFLHITLTPNPILNPDPIRKK